MPSVKPMPVKLSGDLVEEARHSAARFHRSLTGQIEHWAAIGRAVEAQLPGDAVAALLEKLGGTMRIDRVSDAPQREQVMAVLAGFLRMTPSSLDWLDEMGTRGIPIYGSEPGESGEIQRRNPDGSIETLASAH
jgi:ParD-like antitoxin of type II bacterial toxin-antitoxin system